MRVVEHWHNLPREVVDALSLGTFKVGMDRALSNLVQGKVPLSMRCCLNVPSNTNHSGIL